MVPTDRAVVLPSPSRLLGQTSDCLGSGFILCAMADQSSYLSGMRGVSSGSQPRASTSK